MTQLDQTGRGQVRRRGDLFVEVQVETPTGLTAEQKDLLQTVLRSRRRRSGLPAIARVFRARQKLLG